jgi:hypothetical protein
MILKLSAFAKFDLDTKINSYQFSKLIESITTVVREIEREEIAINEETGQEEMTIVKETVNEIDNDKFDSVMGYFEKAFRDGTPPFQGDLDNENYKGFIAKMREFVPDDHVQSKP